MECIAPDTFIQKLRAIYLIFLVFSHCEEGLSLSSRGAKTNQDRNTLKYALNLLLKEFYCEMHGSSAISKYMVEFLQTIDF